MKKRDLHKERKKERKKKEERKKERKKTSVIRKGKKRSL